MENKYLKLKEEPIKKLLLEFSLPAILGMLVNALYNIVDRIYIGNIHEIGKAAITGVGVTFPVMILSLAFALLIGLGGSTNISLFLGKGDIKKSEKYLGSMCLLSIIVGIILSFLTIYFMNSYIEILGASPDTKQFAMEYLEIVAYGFPIFILGYSLNSAVRSDGNPKIAMITLLLGTITNIILDPILIFELNLGVKGAAIATISSQFVSTLWTFFYFISRYSGIKLHFKNIKTDFTTFKSIITIGTGPFILQIASSFITFLFNSTFKVFGGDIQIGAMTIVNSINSMILMPIFGINQGLQPILGFNYGAKHYSRVKEAFYLAIKGATIISILGFTLVHIASVPIIRIFTTDPELLSATKTGIKLFTLMLPFIGFQSVATIYFQAVGKHRMTTFLSLIRQIIFLVPLIIGLSRVWEAIGVWIAVPCSDFLSVIVTAILTKKEIKNLKKLELKKN